MGKTNKVTTAKSNTAARVRKHREKMKAMGLKPVTLWLPDTSTPSVQAEIRRQCLSLRADAEEKEVLLWCEAAAASIEGWVWNDDLDEKR